METKFLSRRGIHFFCAFPQKKPFDKKARASAHTNLSIEKADMTYKKQ